MRDVLPVENLGLFDEDEHLSGPQRRRPQRRRTAVSTQPAISYGGQLDPRKEYISTLADALDRAASQFAEHGVVYIQPDGSEYRQDYPALLEDAKRITAGLKALGLRPQDKIIFQISRAQDFLPAFWGSVLGGFVPVPISVAPTSSDPSKLHHAWY